METLVAFVGCARDELSQPPIAQSFPRLEASSGSGRELRGKRPARLWVTSEIRV
jgi:hypothetical protein